MIDEWLQKYYACMNEALFQKLLVLYICQYFEKMCLLKFSVEAFNMSGRKSDRNWGKIDIPWSPETMGDYSVSLVQYFYLPTHVQQRGPTFKEAQKEYF